MLPFATGELSFPADQSVLFLQARAGAVLPAGARQWTCEQGFRPFADQLARAGLGSSTQVQEGTFAIVLVLPPRQRDASRALLVRALERAGPDGTVVVSVANTGGARSAEADLEKLAGPLRSLSKNKCRVFWSPPELRQLDAELAAQWASLDAPRPIADGRFLSRPGLFAWDRIDTASALLARNLPPDLGGRGADLGAGFGYLAAEVISRCPGVHSLDLFEADARAIDLARCNLAALAPADRAIKLGYHWHDVSAGVPGTYDFIVSNPPFHQGRADQPQLGRAFIAAAAAALAPGGRLWLVANRHLPYEAALAQAFAKVRTVCEADGFKVIEAIKARA